MAPHASPTAAATTTALMLSALLALALAQQEPVCYEPAQPSPQAKQVRFGSGELNVPPGPNGERAPPGSAAAAALATAALQGASVPCWASWRTIHSARHI